VSPPAVTARAPAKVNLRLEVGAPQPDGYHPLATVFHAVSLFDDVTASPVPAGDADVQVQVTVTGTGAGQVPLDESNLAVRAALLLADVAGVAEPVRLHVRKGIPVAGGMAGGSADAAAALVACDALVEDGAEPPRAVRPRGRARLGRAVRAARRDGGRHRPRRPADARARRRGVPLGGRVRRHRAADARGLP
jgi:4-diphosphocytidyl-2-C-methyl-D-erythritol kinase